MTGSRLVARIGWPTLVVPLLAVFSLWLPAALRAEDGPGEEFAQQPTWTIPKAAAVRADVVKWLDSRKVAGPLRDQALAIWPEGKAEPAGSELLDRTVQTIALVDPPAKDLVALCAKPHAVGPLPKFAWLTDAKTDPLVRNNLRLWYGRWLAQEKLYDEALDQLGGLETTDVVDPASLLFYQSAAHHWLLHKEAGLKTISRLLERKKELPRRYAQMADLMQTDLAGLKDDSLDHIDRRMRDTERHLDLGRAGKKVRTEEDGIIASLDKLIDKMEKDQAAAMAMANSQMGPGGKQSSMPAPDSARLGGKGPGEIEKKPIGHKDNWGDLPPKDRQEVLQAIGKEFPSHFRDVIEQYFKKLAMEEGTGE